MKMTAHCKRGGDIEVMGMLQGYAKDDAFIVLDVFELPVEGTETRVNAQAEAYEYMVEYTHCLLYTSPSPRDLSTSRMPSSA